MRISDWSSDVCSSDLRVHAVVTEIFAHRAGRVGREELKRRRLRRGRGDHDRIFHRAIFFELADDLRDGRALLPDRDVDAVELLALVIAGVDALLVDERSEEHTSELQSLMRISYAVFCLKKK